MQPGHAADHSPLLVLQSRKSRAISLPTSGIPRNFVQGGGSTNSVEDRGKGSGGGSPLLRGSGGSCNFVQEISFHIVKSS